MMSRTSPAPILAPIQSLSNVLNERISEEPQQEMTAYGHDVSQIVSPAPPIKSEQNGTPREVTPSTTALHTEENNSGADGLMDTETLKAVEALKKNDLGLRAKSRETATPAAETLKPTAAPSKKRPAPKSTAAANKKGTAAKKPAAKKRKLDAETSSVGGTPSVRRSATPRLAPLKRLRSALSRNHKPNDHLKPVRLSQAVHLRLIGPPKPQHPMPKTRMAQTKTMMLSSVYAANRITTGG